MNSIKKLNQTDSQWDKMTLIATSLPFFNSQILIFHLMNVPEDQYTLLVPEQWMKLHIDSAVMLYFQELHIELNLRVSYLNNASFYDWPLDYHKSKNSKKK